MYIVRHSGTVRDLGLSCPVGLLEAYDVRTLWGTVGLPGAYDVLCEAQFDYFKSVIG